MTQTNTNKTKSFDDLYKEYESLSVEEQLTNLKQLGKEFVIKIDQICLLYTSPSPRD